MFAYVSLSLFRILSPSFIFSRMTIASIFAYVKYILLVTVVHVKMKLGENALNNERFLLVITKLPIKK